MSDLNNTLAQTVISYKQKLTYLDNNAAARDHLAGLAFPINLAEPRPLTKLLVVINLWTLQVKKALKLTFYLGTSRTTLFTSSYKY